MTRLPPAQIKKLFSKARAAQSSRDFAQAIKLYERILKSAPNLPEVHFNLGEIYAAQGKTAEAARGFEAALKLRPNEPAIWNSYLAMAARHPRIDNLKALLRRVGTLLDQHPDIDFYRGLVAQQSDRSGAVDLFRAALSNGSKSNRIHVELGKTLSDLGQNEAALDAYDARLETAPNDEVALHRKSELLRNMGRYDEALESARRAIEVKPNIGAFYYAYTTIRKMTEDDPVLKKMQTVFPQLKASDQNRSGLAHALAKAMADIGKHEEVFRYLDAAAQTIRGRFGYDVSVDQRTANEIAELYDRMAFSFGGDQAAKPPTPVFVTGLPRSGTTLIEQILASHSDVDGGGELGLLGSGITACLKDAHAQNTPQFELEDQLRKIGDGYRRDLRERFDLPFVTDKSISTYAFMGFAQVALPDARFIVVRRNPGDNALSIYKNYFQDGMHRYSNDLGDIARFMHVFERQLGYWREKIPERFLEVNYEDVVADLEEQARSIVSFAGLSWQDACLEFHRNTRKVDTLSTTQVRQPIYSSSVGAWKRHETEMQRFFDVYEGERQRP